MTSITLQLGQRGVITIPKSVRDPYGWQPGDALTLLDLAGFTTSSLVDSPSVN